MSDSLDLDVDSNLQFEKGSYVSCYCESLGSHMKAQILDFKQKDNTAFAYITFVGQDKRLDDWFPVDSLKVISSSDDEDDASQDSRFDDDDKPESNQFELVHREVTKIRNIECITLGAHKMRTWYYSPYPHQFHNTPHLYICEYCFEYFQCKEDLARHQSKNKRFEPYGREIYRDGKINIYEMKGNCQKVPCQCLCLLGKLFLDHKTLYYDVEKFSFYLLCECDDDGCHLAAYSSREVDTEDQNVLACIVVFPPFQKRGYGRLLISLSYEIARRKRMPGGPERPLSDLGQRAFTSFWRDKIVEMLRDHPGAISTIENLVELTGIAEEDIKNTLEMYQLAHVVLGKTKITINHNSLTRELNILSKKTEMRFIPRKLIWMPDDDLYDM
ncbi:putative MYST-like histone acetyltransferase 1 [Tritrichomonas foetus]|uniref:Histone acetyltransferase n=1 Tax=Tritrichomonas foetus TaxID=1144522 RepID=A0A1J4KEP5_9EUKA|nr:putative MYST-like histone acetyltransferase 1 [Tritrichomonas foetus]|eukprot:OHT08220.1 putative MYST-like histone acetyltransferase 1 [Tritrichomonas foetus]